MKNYSLILLFLGSFQLSADKVLLRMSIPDPEGPSVDRRVLLHVYQGGEGDEFKLGRVSYREPREFRVEAGIPLTMRMEVINSPDFNPVRDITPESVKGLESFSFERITALAFSGFDRYAFTCVAAVVAWKNRQAKL